MAVEEEVEMAPAARALEGLEMGEAVGRAGEADQVAGTRVAGLVVVMEVVRRVVVRWAGRTEGAEAVMATVEGEVRAVRVVGVGVVAEVVVEAGTVAVA